MKTSHIVLIVIFAYLWLPSCKKNDTSGSSYTNLMCESHNFHLVERGYNPSQQKQETDSSDMSASITCNSASNVLFSGATFVYDSTTAAGVLYFHYLQSSQYSSNGGYLEFDHVNNKIYVYESIHVSAGAGNWSYSYTSF
jgi:hypothetical protein